MISAQLLDADPETGAPVDYIAISRELEEKVRARIEGENLAVAVEVPVSVHMIGFAKVVGDVADGALSVATFAVATIALTLLFVWIYIQSFTIAQVPVIASLVAMVWMMGLLSCSAMALIRSASSCRSSSSRSGQATASRRSARSAMPR
jgi:hypothetical protein